MKRSMTMMTAVLATGLLAAAAASAVGGTGGDRELRALTRKVERLEREVRDLSKAVRALEKSLAAADKEASAVRRAAKSLDDRSDQRTLLLGEWFDRYHAKSNGRWHRGAIRRIR